MLFSFKRLLPVLGALSLLQGVLLRPLLPRADTKLVGRQESVEDVVAERTGGQIQRQAQRDFVEESLLERTLSLSDAAKDELNRMGLHGKERKKVIHWHKKQVKKEIKNNPLLKPTYEGRTRTTKTGEITGETETYKHQITGAKTGVIEHIAHKGGSNPKEKNHITASFRDPGDKHIINKYNGGTHHHIYVNSNKGLSHQADVAMDKNNARINPGQTRAHEMSVGHYAGPGKSKNKGKGKNRSSAGFSKNPNKGFSPKGGK